MPGAHICYNLPSRTCRPCSPSSSQPSADTWLGKLWHTWARGPGPRASESLGPGPGRPGPESGPRPWGRGPRGRPGAPGPRAYVCEYFPLAPSRTVLPLAAACRRCLLWRRCRCLLWRILWRRCRCLLWLAAAAFCARLWPRCWRRRRRLLWRRRWLGRYWRWLRRRRRRRRLPLRRRHLTADLGPRDHQVARFPPHGCHDKRDSVERA